MTEILLSEFACDNDYLRLDSEFSLKHSLAVVRSLRDAGAERFGESKPQIIHPHEITREYIDPDGVWFFRAQNLRPLAIEDGDKVFVSAQDALTLGKNQLQNGDVVITRTGANAGDCALFFSDVPAVASSHTFIVRCDGWSHAYLVAFFNSTYGRSQILKGRYGAAQPEVAPYYLRGIWIPRFSAAFDAGVGRLFERSREQRAQATAGLAAAEQTLLIALGLDDWHPPEPLTYVRRASEVAPSARFDALYFSPAKTESVGVLGEKGAKPLSAYFKPIRDMVSLDAIGGARVMNFDVGAASRVVLDESSPSVENFDSAKKRFHPGDVVISRLRHYLRQIAVVRMPADATVLGSSEFIVLRPISEALPQEALVLFLRCLPAQTILKYSQDGSHHPRFSDDDLLAIPVPDAMLAISAELTASVRIAHAARVEAQTLLARAQRAVEVAIEQGEPAAMKLLK